MATRTLPGGKRIKDLSEVEFRVYSQWGEDGIIEWLAAHVPVPNTRFIEFGVGTFREANCRFLMHNRNWKGLVIYGTEANMASLLAQTYFCMYDLITRSSFCVRGDLAAFVLELIEDPRAFPSRPRDSRDRNGNLAFAGGSERFALIADMPVVDVQTGQTLRLGDIEQPYSDAWLA